jgi:hypothetical protein
MQNLPRSIDDHSSSLIVDYSDAPEIYHEAPQQISQAQQAQHPWSSSPGKSPLTEKGSPPGKGAHICGVPRQTFWFIVILLIVVVTAAAGGGVGWSLAVRNAK